MGYQERHDQEGSLLVQERTFDDQEAVQARPAHEDRKLDESCGQGPQGARDHGIRPLESWTPGSSALQARQVVHVDAFLDLLPAALTVSAAPTPGTSSGRTFALPKASGDVAGPRGLSHDRSLRNPPTHNLSEVIQCY